MISQLTVFLENHKGRLAGVCRSIADAGINMSALLLADTEDFGVLRVFCDRPEAAASTLRDEGFRASVTSVLGVQVPNRSGGLADLLEFLDKEGVNVEYAYCFSISADFALNALKVSDGAVERRLAEAGWRLVTDEEIHGLG
ncbi:MAG: amino acid-binding protein [Eggerthellaceae bacterium]|jgi:hypothetical protein|nr:amino acid-binding protein [Eggerthellaceae bacterium]MDR2715314.1 amino acid-binding protein [Coriobacteriaceae bacterium]